MPTLANIIDVLAASRSLEDSMLQCLELLRTALGAAECAIWLHAPAGIRRAWGAGVGRVKGAVVRGGSAAGVARGIGALVAGMVAGK